MRRALPLRSSRPLLGTRVWTAASPSTVTWAPKRRWRTTRPKSTSLTSWGSSSWRTSAWRRRASRRPLLTCCWRWGEEYHVAFSLSIYKHFVFVILILSVLAYCWKGFENLVLKLLGFLSATRPPQSAPLELSRKSSSQTSWTASWNTCWLLMSSLVRTKSSLPHTDGASDCQSVFYSHTVNP